MIGATGFVGSVLAEALIVDHEVLGTHRRRAPDEVGFPLAELDLEDGRAVDRLVDAFRPDVAINLAGKAVVTETPAQLEPDVSSIRRLAAAVGRKGGRVVFVSTDYVFDGRDGPYSESDAPNPINGYGMTKLAEELALQASAPDALVVRTSLVYGWPRRWQHSNFVADLVSRLSAGDEVVAYVDMVRTPIFVEDLAQALSGLIAAGVSGLIHVGSDAATSMLHFALAACRVFDLDTSKVRAVPSPRSETTPKPRRCGLRTNAASAVLGYPLPPVRAGLRRMRSRFHE